MNIDNSFLDRPIEIFLNQQNAYNYQCVICQSVFTEATSIGCKQDDMFCKQCLESYFANNQPKQCPSCRQHGLSKANIRPCKYIDRIINSARVKCLLQYQNAIQDNINAVDCKWSGDLIDLPKHINIDCPLYLMVCDDCKLSMRRCDAQKHIMICPEKKLLCPQRCNKKIARKKMATHKRYDCAMTKLTCDDCKNDVFRKDMNKHIINICSEYEMQCPFYEYGCNVKVKRRLIVSHLQQQEMMHLKLKVASLEGQIAEISRTIDNDNKKIFMITKSNQMHVADLKSKAVKSSLFKSPRGSYHYCVAKNVSFFDGIKMGFDRSVLSVFGNDVIINVLQNRITRVHVNSMTAIHIEVPIHRRHYTAIYHNIYGLLLVGGCDAEKNGIMDICCVDSNEYIKIPDLRRGPSLCLSNDQNLLFMCGGFWDKYLSSCYVYNFSEDKWTDLRNMNHAHCDAPIYLWRERRDKIIVASGYTSTFVEEYDPIKDVWIDLPNVHNKHGSNSALFGCDNLLFCIGGAMDDKLGCIEMYDPRDHKNQWILLDNVERYFNIKENCLEKHTKYNWFFYV